MKKTTRYHMVIMYNIHNVRNRQTSKEAQKDLIGEIHAFL
jgi:hypothetical protein